MSRSSRTFRWGKNLELTFAGRMELSKQLEKLSSRDARKVMRAAVMSGLRIGGRRLKAKVPVGANKRIKSSVGVSFKKNPKDKAGVPVGKFGVNVGRKRKDMVSYGFAVMAGTKKRWRYVEEKITAATTIGGTPKKRRKRKRKAKRKVTKPGFTGRIRSKHIVQNVARGSRGEILNAIRQKVSIGVKRVLQGQKVSDGGQFDKSIVKAERSKAKRAKHRQKIRKNIAKRVRKSGKNLAKKARRTSKKVIKKTSRSVKRVTKRVTKSVKRVKKNTSRKVKRATKNLTKAVRKNSKSLKQQLFGKPKRKRRK